MNTLSITIFSFKTIHTCFTTIYIIFRLLTYMSGANKTLHSW